MFVIIRRDIRRVFRRCDVFYWLSCFCWIVLVDVVFDVLVGFINDVGVFSVVVERVVVRGVFFVRFVWDVYVVGNFLMDFI